MTEQKPVICPRCGSPYNVIIIERYAKSDACYCRKCYESFNAAREVQDKT